MFEGLKDFVTPSHFSLFGYVVAILYLFSGVIFPVIVGNLRAIERENFRCDVPDSLENKNTLPLRCFDDYEQHFNSPLPLYGFVLLSFLSSVVVCIIYSWCCVKAQVERIDADYNTIVEDPRPTPIITTRRVFWSYLLQLLLRLVLGVSFALLQKLVLFPSDSPTGFLCDSLSKSAANTTNNSSTNGRMDASRITCHNSVGSEKTVWAKVVWIVNIVFTVVLLGEMIYLAVLAWKRKEFVSDSEFCQKYFFNRDRYHLPTFLRQMMKNRIDTSPEINQFEATIAQCPGEQANTKMQDDMYVNLIIHTGRAAHDFERSQHEILSYEYVKPQDGSIAMNKPEDLLLPNKDASDPRKILIIGRPGIGKTLLCNKLMRNWADHVDEMSRDENNRFEMPFLFRFRWFNSEKTENQCLQKLLGRAVASDGNIDKKMFQYALDNPDKVLLVFDGLDEFKYHESCLADERAECENGPADVMRISALYVKLVQGKLLPGATVVTTCRPNVVGSLMGLNFDRTVEIMGFTPEKVHEYVEKFCKDDGERQAISNHIESNLNLLSLCYIPATCHIICTILEKVIQLQRNQQGSGTVVLPTTLTEVYQIASVMYIWKHHPEYRDKVLKEKHLSFKARFTDSVEKTLAELGRLARRGTDERRLIFREEEVQGMEDCGLLNRMPDTVKKPFTVEENFCFIHLTLQEFLAARDIATMNSDELSRFISSNATDPKWQLVIQFVAGLLRDQQNNKVVNIIVNLLRDSLSSNWGKMALLMMKCVYDFNDDTAANKAATQLQESDTFDNTVNFQLCHISAVDCTALVYFLKRLEQLHELNLKSNPSLGDGGCKKIAKLLREGGPEQLNLSACNITNQGVEDLCEALKHQCCKLSTLNLNLNDKITDAVVSNLCESLKHQDCKLTNLNLAYTAITDEGVSDLCDALKQPPCKLTQLDLASNTIHVLTDTGVSHLCKALKHQHCKLAHLDLTSNAITDKGVRDLCKAIKHEHCNLTRLGLNSSTITDKVIPDLCEVAGHKNLKLFQLILTMSKLSSQGKQKLQNAFANTRCHLSFYECNFRLC